MNQYRKIALLWVLLLAICATLMVSCINPDAGDFYTTAPLATTAEPDATASTSLKETTPEETTPEATTPDQTTTEEIPPRETSPADSFIPYTVTVIDGNNTPLSNAVVQLCVDDWCTIPVLTNAMGVVTIMAKKDDYTVKVTLNGYTGKAEYRFAVGSTALTVQLAKNGEATTPKETTTEKVTSTAPEETTTPEQTTTPEETTTPGEKIKIYIDQGHNPHSWNTGAQGNGLYEENLTFEIGILLYELLLQDDRFEVRLSRPTAETVLGTDNNSALDFRVNDAKEWGADYFISLHINSFTDSSVRGLEVYTATGDDTGYVLGESILNGLVESTELRNRGMKNGDKLRVLKNATMPAALIEMGFISNESDAALLDNSPDLFAKGVYNGILNYFDNLEEKTIDE